MNDVCRINITKTKKQQGHTIAFSFNHLEVTSFQFLVR